jgi:hypothetical protein
MLQYASANYLSNGHMLRKWTGPAILALAGRCTIKCTLTMKNDGGKIVSRRLNISAISDYNVSMSLIQRTGEYIFLKKLLNRIKTALTSLGRSLLTASGNKSCKRMWLPWLLRPIIFLLLTRTLCRISAA